jgi:hypothetical protein
MSADIIPFSKFQEKLQARQTTQTERERQLAEAGLQRMEALFPELSTFSPHSYMDYWQDFD